MIGHFADPTPLYAVLEAQIAAGIAAGGENNRFDVTR
jgi:hypothetical protein